jgi:hypothetical protein
MENKNIVLTVLSFILIFCSFIGFVYIIFGTTATAKDGVISTASLFLGLVLLYKTGFIKVNAPSKK